MNPNTHTLTHTHIHTPYVCGNPIAPLYFYCGLHSADCNKAGCSLSLQGRMGPSLPSHSRPPFPSLLHPPPVGLTFQPYHPELTSGLSFRTPLNSQPLLWKVRVLAIKDMTDSDLNMPALCDLLYVTVAKYKILFK